LFSAQDFLFVFSVLPPHAVKLNNVIIANTAATFVYTEHQYIFIVFIL